jgi:ubiquinone biosynthesis protein Coq4
MLTHLSIADQLKAVRRFSTLIKASATFEAIYDLDDISYITLRRSQTHDIHHVVTGFATDPAGELGLQAFQLAQIRSPIAIAILTAGLINVLANPSKLNAH